jgi:hypothetical protein
MKRAPDCDGVKNNIIRRKSIFILFIPYSHTHKHTVGQNLISSNWLVRWRTEFTKYVPVRVYIYIYILYTATETVIAAIVLKPHFIISRHCRPMATTRVYLRIMTAVHLGQPPRYTLHYTSSIPGPWRNDRPYIAL